MHEYESLSTLTTDLISKRMVCVAATLLRNTEMSNEAIQIELHGIARRLEEIGGCEGADSGRVYR